MIRKCSEGYKKREKENEKKNKEDGIIKEEEKAEVWPYISNCHLRNSS